MEVLTREAFLQTDFDGSGDGSGDGYGYGSGSGSGDGILSFCGQRVYQIDDVPTLIDHVHGGVAMGRILRADLTTESCYIVKQGSLFAHGETLRAAMEALRDKLLEGMPLEERIEDEEFIDLTKGSYGGDIIRRMREAYNKKEGEAT